MPHLQQFSKYVFKDVPWSMVYGDKSKSSQSGSQSLIVAEITKQVPTELRQELRDEIREELREEMRTELSTQIREMKTEMLAIVSHEGSTNHNKQVPDAFSGHCEPTDYDADENPHTPPPNDEDVIKVSLESSVIPRVQLAEGLLISVDPLCEIDGVPIGPEYCKVFVLKANKPNAVLETTSRCLRIVGEAVGRYIVWRSIHVQLF